jgi:sugar lactone lactonase YvrE
MRKRFVRSLCITVSVIFLFSLLSGCAPAANPDTGLPNNLFWTFSNTGKIQATCTTDLVAHDVVSSGITGSYGLAIDYDNAKLYWTDSAAAQIRSAALDGTGDATLISTGLIHPNGIALDFDNDKMYWTDSGTGSIKRANLTGTGVEQLVTGLSAPYGIFIDIFHDRIWWTDPGNGTIGYASLENGTGVTPMLGSLTSPQGIAVDIRNGKLYWTDSSDGKIYRSGLDGSNQAAIVTGLNAPEQMTLDVATGKIYWTDSGSFKVQRANLDGTSVEDMHGTGSDAPSGIALNVTGVVTLYEDHFEYAAASPWTPENGWSGSSAWNIVSGGVSGNAAQWVSGNTPLIYNNCTGSSYTVSVTFQMGANGGFPYSICRILDDENYYSVLVQEITSSPQRTDIQMGKRVAGAAWGLSECKFIDGYLNRANWYTLSISIRGEVFEGTCTGDGTTATLNFGASNFTAGKPGFKFGGGGGTSILFDDFTVTCP